MCRIIFGPNAQFWSEWNKYTGACRGRARGGPMGSERGVIFIPPSGQVILITGCLNLMSNDFDSIILSMYASHQAETRKPPASPRTSSSAPAATTTASTPTSSMCPLMQPPPHRNPAAGLHRGAERPSQRAHQLCLRKCVRPHHDLIASVPAQDQGDML